MSYALWQTWFGGDSSVIGKAYDVGGGKKTAIGVMGPEFKFPPDGTLLWVSSTIRPEGITPGQFGPPLVARMKPGVTTEQLARELTALSKRLPERFGGSANYAKLIGQHRAVVRSLEDQMLGSISGSLWVLLGAVGIVLLIACANVANLFMVRAEGRQRDLAVRRAIGAARGAADPVADGRGGRRRGGRRRRGRRARVRWASGAAARRAAEHSAARRSAPRARRPCCSR